MRNLLISILFGLLTLVPALAQTVTPTNDINNSINHPYQESATTSCSLAGNCQLSFPATTAPKTLITHVSCFIAVRGSAVAPTESSLQILNQGLKSQNYFPTFSQGTNSFVPQETNFGINSDSNLFFAKGQVPIIVIATTGGTLDLLACTLSGYHSVAGQTLP